MTAITHNELPPEAVMFQLLFGAVVERSIYVAAQLRIADLINNRRKTPEELATETSTHTRSLYRLLRLLASRGCFFEGADGRFSNTPLSDLLRSDAPNSMRDFALMIASDWNWTTIMNLRHSVETGGLAFEKAFGKTTWEYFEEHAEEGVAFSRAMTSLSKGQVPPIVEAYDFSQFKKVADIAGGHGVLLTNVLKENPGLSGILFDVPSVIKGAREYLEHAGVADRVEMVSGDFFERVPSGADAYMLKYIIHDWADPESIKILRNVHSAMNRDGKLLLLEMVVPERNEPSPEKVLDIQMLMSSGGHERTAKEYCEILATAGFELTQIIPTKSPVRIIEAVRKALFSLVMLFVLITANNVPAQKRVDELVQRVDHLVYATPDLDRGIAEIEKLLGVRATLGGKHPGRGTKNAFIALGPNSFLEIVAPDPDQPPPKDPRPFFKGLTESRLVRWFINSRDIGHDRDEAVSKGVSYGEVKPGSRHRPDGIRVSWQFTDPSKPVADGVVPFIIDWGDTPHPSQSAAKGATLISLRAEHPDPREAKRLLLALGLKVPVKKAKRPALIATIEGPRGRVELK